MLYLGDHSSSWWLHQTVAGAGTVVMIQSEVPRLNYQTLQRYISPGLSPPVVYIVYYHDLFSDLWEFLCFFKSFIFLCLSDFHQNTELQTRGHQTN